mmetsp:Transcript_70036/g.105872  ORF Transcript_70036/g.105872 Transcript_70036/m.105872 type:complete len:495 (+) Transcript_70036:20-1504(+)
MMTIMAESSSLSCSSKKTPPTKQQIEASLRTLECQTSSLQEKRQAFDIVQLAHVPVINRSAKYAAELSQVFSLRFPIWPATLTTTDILMPYHHDNNNTNSNGNTVSAVQRALSDRIRGLVFGAALGDAVGLSTEFLSCAQVDTYYTVDHIFHPRAEVHPDFHRINFPAGDWTDDTDQLVLVLQTLLENEGRYDGAIFAEKISSWKNHGFPGLGDESGAGLGRTTLTVLNHKEFRTRPQFAAADVWERGGRTMAANGAVMRTAIAGVPFFWDAAAVKRNTIDFCLATHADPRCVASCLVVSECVRRLLLLQVDGSDGSTSLAKRAVMFSMESIVEEIIESAIEFGISGVPANGLDAMYADELCHHARATTLEDLSVDEPGKIGYTFKCMGCGLWAMRKAATAMSTMNDPTVDGDNQAKTAISSNVVIQDILQELVRAGGDADTNGTVAGALLGAMFGFEALPWTNELPYGGWLEAWIQKLLFMCRLPVCAGGGVR